MRNCQICGDYGKRVILNDYNGQAMCLFECTACGHRYVDSLGLTQAWFDEFYLKRYRTDDLEYSDARLNSLADCVAQHTPKPINNVADIGGTDGELVRRLRKLGVMAWGYGVNDEQNEQWKADAVILSHTLEHIYDIGAMFKRIKRWSDKNAWLFIEVPIYLGYTDPVSYDYRWQHINKFRRIDLERLMEQKGYEVRISTQIEDYREYKVWRIVGRSGAIERWIDEKFKEAEKKVWGNG